MVSVFPQHPAISVFVRAFSLLQVFFQDHYEHTMLSWERVGRSWSLIQARRRPRLSFSWMSS